MGAPTVLGQDGDVRTEASLRQKLSFLESENARLRAAGASELVGYERLSQDERDLVARMVALLVANKEL